MRFFLMRFYKSFQYSLFLFFAFLTQNVLKSCKYSKNETDNVDKVVEVKKVSPLLFSKLFPSEANISFENRLTENLDFNYYQYMYSYIGAGLAVNDFNNDGLKDVFLVSNTSNCQLYKNKGSLSFEDITKLSNINPNKGFNVGVTTVDINNDGLLDIYLVRGGLDNSEGKFENLLYVNQGDFKFKEQGKEYGINDSNRGIHATFFDIDNDNDLDLFISNTPDIDSKYSEIIDINKANKNPESKSKLGSDKLYKNLGNGKFKDVSKEAGIYFDIGFGLNPQVGDLNGDGFLDIYVCNDFKVPDFVYINNGDGTFSDKREDFFKHMSHNSMGSDVIDINNDGQFDVVSLDMNPEDYIRSKTTMSMTSIPKFEKMVANGYHHQYMHNMMQVNNGNDTFSDVSNLGGLANTDWSWAVLGADFDLDGYEDIYITNGVFRDVLDQDTTNKILVQLRENGRKPTKEDFLKFAKMLPQQKLKNYLFKNNGDLTFSDKTDEWANLDETFSNGAVYVDLDNDGDLEIITNNIDEPATILKNNSVELGLGNFVTFEFKGPKGNGNGLGVKVVIETTKGKQLTRQLINSRGFLSSVSNRLHFGIEKGDTIKNTIVQWLDGKKQSIINLELNKHHNISYEDAEEKSAKEGENTLVFKRQNFNHIHREKYNNDYNNQLLLPYKFSHLGPAIARADINADGIDDVFIGGAFQDNPKLLLGTASGKLREKTSKAILEDGKFEDVSALFFDVDNDGDQDLYVGSGSYEFSPTSRGQQDRLYLNDGKGNFTKSIDGLPDLRVVTTTVKATDFDNDGDQDLFIGAGVVPGKYPQSGGSYLLRNTGGKFSIANDETDLPKLGLVKDAEWFDINSDGSQDLVVTGEWMGIEVLLNKNGKFVVSEDHKSLSETKGWWNKLLVDDLDGDGDLDIAAGNLGLNMKFHASKEKPFHVYAKDFDFNGVEDIVLAKDYNGKQVPVRGRTCTSQQMPHIAQKIPTFEEFANLGVDGILGKGIDSALHYEVNEFRSGIFVNNNGSFEFEPFLNEVQASLVNSILFEDFDGDGQKDLLLAGNNYQFEIETTRSDAGVGVFLKGTGKGNFEYIPNSKTGFYTKGDVRQLTYLPSLKKVIVGINDGEHQLYDY